MALNQDLPDAALNNDIELERPRLTIREKVGYSLGDLASNLYFQMFIAFLPIFYTDVFGITPAAVGTMFLVTRMWDAINDPIMGMIADRTESRWGKFRPYIAALAIPLAIAGILTFTTPDFSDTGKLVYAYITYILLVMLYTAINVPYAALMGVITPNSVERTEVSSYRFVAAFIGQIIVGSSTLFLVRFLGGGNAELGWQMTLGAYGLFAVVLLLTTFFMTRERVTPAKVERNKIRDDLGDLIRNKAWIFAALATVFQLTYIVMRGSSTAYYFQYYVGEQHLQFLWFNWDLTYEVFTSSFLTIGSVATMIGAVTTKLYVKKIDKKNIYGGFLITSAVLSCLFVFLQPHHVLMIYVLNILVSYFIGVVSVLQWAIYADAADFGEWKFGRRSTALIMAASLFALKLGLTFGGAFVGWILELHQYVANVPQVEEALIGIRLLMSIYPAAFGILAGLLMLLFYPLKDNMMVKIEDELAARNKAKESADS